eukprot:CAMPEP_0184325612 /NCGR_PEP_ID=MMETSP1049-20130417/141284_1 /TAXON_ID=77928 /ORGANISM="Proteomonas sulcata, Strain CCMP704" /LENGTH=85 /DNA_ID=CAMNT_0026647717 /DNA_START=8 /DNA_END=262 /DNA_ORIENTATION=-
MSPLYDTLGAKAVEHIINEAEVTTVFVERSKLDKLIEGKGKALKYVILFEDPTDEEKKKCSDAKLTLYSVADLKKSASETPGEPN